MSAIYWRLKSKLLFLYKVFDNSTQLCETLFCQDEKWRMSATHLTRIMTIPLNATQKGKYALCSVSFFYLKPKESQNTLDLMINSERASCFYNLLHCRFKMLHHQTTQPSIVGWNLQMFWIIFPLHLRVHNVFIQPRRLYVCLLLRVRFTVEACLLWAKLIISLSKTSFLDGCKNKLNNILMKDEFPQSWKTSLFWLSP